MIEIIVRKDDKQILGINYTGHGYVNPDKNGVKKRELPDQDVDPFYNEDGTLQEIYFPDDKPYPLEFAKQKKLDEIRSKANEIITEKWPPWKQQNCNAGIYPQSVKDQKDQDIADVISASNTVEDKVNNASVIADVEAVTPNWPTI